MRAPGPCAECGAGGAARYRCPRCGSAYCSVPCCRTHRERCAPEPRQQPQREAAGQVPPPDPAHGPGTSLRDILGEEDEQDRVPPEKLQLLGESEELRDLLLNPHLQQLLLTIDQAQDKSSLMRRFMQEPLFVEFADCCLSIVEPPEKENVLPE
ncbi:PREDICTED: zinc finger HIT domain-containing protein 3 [Ficedula albicollis]|uniref:zinc finger HIT domain-containing protein 3 n=1 Tax=Ficedula albicollis TaxID=59894 RepID=UPI0003597C7E|nr:PREDICTED: zinc finger HIT domain-containing protein 3 [Ficedula albicollis]